MLYKYIVEYSIPNSQGTPFTYTRTFWAEDSDHAREQAEPYTEQGAVITDITQTTETREA